MEWYYENDDRKVGPVSEQDIEDLARSGTIIAETKVWNDVITKWIPYGQLKSEIPGDAVYHNEEPHTVNESVCVECRGTFLIDEMIEYEGVKVCSSCKPVFFQKVKEGGHHGAMVYGGFWIRFAAKFIDGIILGAISMIFTTVAGFSASNAQDAVSPFQGVLFFLQIAIPIAYATFFIGKYAATPGKMICGLKIVTADGDRVSYGRAVGRHFSEFISSLIMAIGYIMAAFDEEKRTLHDRICNTRVIKK